MQTAKTMAPSGLLTGKKVLAAAKTAKALQLNVYLPLWKVHAESSGWTLEQKLHYVKKER